MTQHHRFEVVVQADAGDAAEMMEGMHVLTQGRRQIHRLDEAQVLPARVAEQVAEQVDAPAAFAREVDVIDAIVHLCLQAWPGLKARHGWPRGARPQQPEALTHDRVLAGEAACLQFLQGALGGEVRILGEQFLQDRLERIDDAAGVDAAGVRARPGRRAGLARAPTRASRRHARCPVPWRWRGATSPPDAVARSPDAVASFMMLSPA